MDTVKILLSLVILLVLVVSILVRYILNIKKALGNMLLVLENIKDGNENRRILSKGNEATADICYKINEIVANNKSKIIELKSSEKAYKQLLTSLSHDVRTPLTSLIGYLDAIHNKIVDGTEKDEYLEIARNKAYDMKEFVDMLFEWFKLDSKERRFYFEDTDINELTRSILTDWIPVFDKNAIACHVEISEEEYNLPIDINAYTRIINNIVHNSMVHSGGNQIDISIIKKNDTIVISISDNGKGIEEKEIQHIFERLYKCDKSRSHKGSGLGLSIVKELVSAHHGIISVSSISHEKTTFAVILPIKKDI